MTVLGISVYPDLRPMGEIVSYFERAAKYGFTRVFSSMFSMEGTPQEVLSTFKAFNDAAHKYGMEVSLDINPECMKRLGATPEDLSVFDAIGADILRMDGAYGEDDNVRMLSNPYGMRIEYNASALTPQEIGSLASRGVDLDRMLACHNFYPQRYTGFRWDKFCEVTSRLREMNIRVGAFISSHAPNTHGVWDATDGLPTVERLRDFPAELQARLLVAARTTDVLFGNAYASEDELLAVQAALAEEGRHMVRVATARDASPIEREILFEFADHFDFGDSSEWMWRSRLPRVAYKDASIEPRACAKEYFEPGDVVMVNDAYKHYAGEVQVVLRPMKNDGIRNLVARVGAQEYTIFDVLSAGDVVGFVPTEEEFE